MIPRIIAKDILEPTSFFIGRWVIRLITLGYYFPNPESYPRRVFVMFVGGVASFTAILSVFHLVNR